MLARIWWCITLRLSALLLGRSFGQTVEIPVRLKRSGPTWLAEQQSLYRLFDRVGIRLELATLVAVGALERSEKLELPPVKAVLLSADPVAT